MAQPRRSGLSTLALAALLGLLLSADAWSQSGQPAAGDSARPARKPAEETPVATCKIELDLLGLLRSRDVFFGSAEDAIWQVGPGPGRILVQLPLVITPGKAPVTLTGSEVKLKGARFLAWKLVDDPELAPKNSDAAREIEKAMGDDIPRFTRKLTINPDGSMEWGLDRFILQGDVKKSTPLPRSYQMKLKREYLDELRPTPPSSSRGGESPAAFRARLMAEESAYRGAQQRYIETQKTVNALEDEFKDELPERIWAVYDLPSHVQDLDISGVETGQWKIPLPVFRGLRDISKSKVQLQESADGTKYLGSWEAEVIVQLSMMTAQKKPFDHRVVAYVLSLTGMVGYAQMGDPLFLLVKSVLEGPDSQAQRIMVKELLNVIPPTRATATLMQLVAQRGLDVGNAVDVLTGLTKIDLSSSPDQIHKVLGTANQMLEDPNGPPPSEVLQALYQAARDQPSAGTMLANGVQFNRLPPQRLDLVIIDVVEQAGVEPLASSWLNDRFLGAPDPAMLDKVLQIIISAQSAQGGAGMTPVVRSGLDLVFGQPKHVDAKVKQTAKLKAFIPIPNSNHGLFRALQHGDPRLRTQAWQSINQFELVTTGQEEQEMASRNTDRYQVLLELALNQAPTPPQVVAFFSRQPDQDRATAAMVQLVLRGGTEASSAAARSLLNSGKPLADTMLALAFGERQGFAMRMYENLTGRSAPLVTALLRQRNDRNPLVHWLGTRIAAGELPAPSAWAGNLNQEQLIDLASSNDVELARGAVAALVNAIGGSDRDAAGFAQELRRLPDQSPANLMTQWQEFRKGFYTRAMQRYGGPYRLVLRVFEGTPTPPPGDAAPTQTPDRETLLGVVQLVADGNTVSLGSNVAVSVPSEAMALRIDKPADLKNFPNEEVSKLPLEEVQSPVDLRPQADGTWRGEVTLSGGRRIEVVMQPAREDA